MKRGVEKSGVSTHARLIALLDTLALVSVVIVLVGSMLTASGASWKVRAYASIVAMLFDIIFTVEFFSRLAAGERPWLVGVGSVVPLLAVSGPFLFGWAGADLSASAVRGFWLAGLPASALAVAAALRMLRVGRALGDDGTRPRLTPLLAACMTACAVMIMGAVAFQGNLLPGPALADRQRHEAAIATIAASHTESERLAAAKAAGAMALRIEGRVVLPVDHVVSPADYVASRLGTVEAWFPASARVRARGAFEAILAFAGLAFAAAYGIVSRFHRDPRHRHSASASDGEAPASDARAGRSDTPAGVEELAGILGKRPR